MNMQYPLDSTIRTHLPYRSQTGESWRLCWCCHRRLLGHPSLCHCGQPHYCEGRPLNWCQDR
jgi:hypothetical protein